MTVAKKTSAKKTSPAKAKAAPVKAAPVKVETISIVAIAVKAGRSPKVLRAIARNEAYRISQGKARRLPEPVGKHEYNVKDLPAFLEAIKQA